MEFCLLTAAFCAMYIRDNSRGNYIFTHELRFVSWLLLMTIAKGFLITVSYRLLRVTQSWCLTLCAHLLTPWCRVLLDQLTVLQLVKKFPAFHGTRRFITALTSVRHLSISWASPVHSIYPHPTSWRSILILSTHLRLCLPSGLFPSGYPHQDPIHHPLLTHTRYMPTLCTAVNNLTLILLRWSIWWDPNNAGRWQMGFNSAFKGSIPANHIACLWSCVLTIEWWIETADKINEDIRVKKAQKVCHTGLLTACCSQAVSKPVWHISLPCAQWKKNSWWWTEELSETCSVLFQK